MNNFLVFSLTDEYIGLIWVNQFMVWSILYLVLGMSTVCLVFEAKKGFLALSTVLFYPIFLLGMVGVWSVTGTYFEDSVLLFGVTII